MLGIFHWQTYVHSEPHLLICAPRKFAYVNCVCGLQLLSALLLDHSGKRMVMGLTTSYRELHYPLLVFLSLVPMHLQILPLLNSPQIAKFEYALYSAEMLTKKTTTVFKTNSITARTQTHLHEREFMPREPHTPPLLIALQSHKKPVLQKHTLVKGLEHARSSF